MPGEPPQGQRLSELLSPLTEEDASALIAEARAEARSRVRALLTQAFEQSMLEAVKAQLPGREAGGPPAQASPLEQAPPPGPASAPAPAAPPAQAGARTPGIAPAAPAVPADEPAPDSPSGVALYVYGVVSATRTAPLELLGEVEAPPVRAIHEGKLAALVSDVPLLDFAEDRLREHLSDMAWVETTARRHEQVLDAIAASGTVIPMRMCTVYETEAGIRALLARERDALLDALGRLDGKSEWGVKVFCHAAAGQVPDDEPPAPARGASGAEYMQRRLRQRDARAAAAARVADAAERIHEGLAAVAADALTSPPQRPEVSGRASEMVLNGVYLVCDESEQEFHAEVEALADEFEALGLELEETGPWPAYNFVPGSIGAGW